MAHLFLAPVDAISYESTLKSRINLSDWVDRPDNFPESARVWGIKTDPEMGEWKRNRRSVEAMERNDPILFYRNGNYFAKGRVGHQTKTEYIRDNYWSESPAIHIFTVHEYEEGVNLSREELNSLLNYADNYHPQGLRIVNNERPVDNILRRIDMPFQEKE